MLREQQRVEPFTLAAAAPADCPVPEIGKRMRCSGCGSRKVHTAPELYPGGIKAMRTRWGGGGE